MENENIYGKSVFNKNYFVSLLNSRMNIDSNWSFH